MAPGVCWDLSWLNPRVPSGPLGCLTIVNLGPVSSKDVVRNLLIRRSGRCWTASLHSKENKIIYQLNKTLILGRLSGQVYHATNGLRFRDAGRRIFGPKLREGSDDRLLRSGQRDRPQEHMQEVRPVGIRFMYRPHVRLQPAGQSTDLSPLPSRA